MKKIIQFLVAAFLISTPALAETSPQTGLTETQVRKLSTDLSDAYKKNLKEAEDIIKSSYTEDATFIFESPGMPVTTLTKKQYLANLKNYHTAAQGVNLVYKIDSIKISTDKKSAALKDTATIQKQLTDPNQKDKKLTIKALTKCEKTVVLSNDNRAQIKGVKCKSQPQAATPSKK